MHSSIPQPPERESTDGTVDGVDAFIDAISDQPDTQPVTSPLSDLDRAAASRLRSRWLQIPDHIRATIVRTMVEDAEDHIERHYARAFIVACDDPDADVRLAAFDGLWENETPELLDLLFSRSADEPDARVREAMAIALGRFAFDSDDDNRTDAIRAVLFDLWEGDAATDVRRRALESLGFLEGDDIIEAIEDAFASSVVELRASALQAMGRQASDRWIDACLQELRSDDPELRFEALVAIGSIGHQRTVGAVIDAIDDEDTEVALAAIAALGAIGGPMAINRLRQLVQDGNQAIAEAAEDALQEASIMARPLRPLM